MTEFRVWAPEASQVELAAGAPSAPSAPSAGEPGAPGVELDRHLMARDAGGWWRAEVPGVVDYGYLVDGEGPFPDPRSPWQPYGVHGLSRVYDHGAYGWRDGGWHGRPAAGAVFYELHVGTFAATFDGAIACLDHLVDLGVDVVELLPVAAFPGRHGWGYDGVHLWAVHDPYGGPDGLKRLVDACHERGLAVALDVVYNHLGPSGNYLGRYGPYLTSAHQVPWGPAVNFDQPGSDEVREFVLGNAEMWLRDYHIDGLRLDAVHAIEDHRAVHILEEMAGRVAALSAATGREHFLIAESDLNDPRVVTPVPAGGHGLDGQWNDDFHHALHAALTGERQGYYCDFGAMSALAKTLTGAFFHDGIWSTFRGRSHGRRVDVTRTPGHRFLGYLQDHDQIGNRAIGDRIPPPLLRVGAGLVLTSPFTPMLFMGEEWGASTPWQYFTDHVDIELAGAVSAGRRAEFARYGWDAADVPDPQDPATYARSCLDWSEPERGEHAELLAWYRSLIALRRAEPALTDPSLVDMRVAFDEAGRWITIGRGPVVIAANLSGQTVELLAGANALRLGSAPDVRVADGRCSLPPMSLGVFSRE